jgi:hypothetical protein
MMNGQPEATIGTVVQTLSSRDIYFSHGSAIDHVEAKALGLAVEYLGPDDPIWQRIWLLYSFTACMSMIAVNRGT